MYRVQVYEEALQAIFSGNQMIDGKEHVEVALSPDACSHYQSVLSTTHTTLQHHPDDAQTWYDQAEALANLGRYSEALTSFERVIALNSDCLDAWVFQAVVLLHLHQYQAALTSCDRALELQSDHPQAWIFRGAALQKLGRYRQAYTSYDRALGIERPSLGQRLKAFWQGLLSPSH